MTVAARPQRPGPSLTTDIATVGPLRPAEVLSALGVDPREGLTTAEVARRRAECGPNAVTSHRARFLPVLWHQLRSPLLGLLLAAAVASYFVGERSDAVIIGVIVALSVGLGFVNEYRAEKAAEALHAQIRHEAPVIRDGRPVEVDVTALVPGDMVELQPRRHRAGRHPAARGHRPGVRRVGADRRIAAGRQDDRAGPGRTPRWPSCPAAR